MLTPIRGFSKKPGWQWMLVALAKSNNISVAGMLAAELAIGMLIQFEAAEL